MPKQRAREIGALPWGLVKPGEVFDWHTLEPWADKVDDDEPVTAGQAGGVPDAPVTERVVPGRSERAGQNHKPGKPTKADTPDKF